MSLAILPRTRAPLIVPRSPARSRILAAANELQRAIDQLFEEAKEQAREKARRDEEQDRLAQTHLARARARAVIRENRVEVSKKVFNNLVEEVRAIEQAADAAGALGVANQLSSLRGRLYSMRDSKQ
jgi:vacuolar-type H+-ATPase subunit E/Vma4